MPTMNQIQAEIAAAMSPMSETLAEVRAYQAAKPKPNPIRDAHAFMVTRLAALFPPKLYADNDPEDFEATSQYLLDVARIVDECILSVGQEVKSSASQIIAIEHFTNVMRDGLEGFSIWEISREVETLKEERAA